MQKGPQPEWEQITPGEIRSAIRHLRDQFDTNVFKCWQVTEKLAYRDLHPEEKVDVADYAKVFPTYLAIVGPERAEEFRVLLADARKPAATFKAYLGLFRHGIEAEVRLKFGEFLSIGRAQQNSLAVGSVEWVKTHLRILIEEQKHLVPMWIKNACDKQDLSATETAADFEESLHWNHWRAPMLIYMQPGGNAPYHSKLAWKREDEAKTKQLVSSLSSDFFLFLDIFLRKITGNEQVHFAKQLRSSLPVVPVISRAPKPPTVLRGGGSGNFGPRPMETLIDFPPGFPSRLIPRAIVVVGEAIEDFPTANHLAELLRAVVAKLTPDLVGEVGAKKFRGDVAVRMMSELCRYLIIANERHSDRAYQHEGDIRKAAEWLRFASELAKLEAGNAQSIPAEPQSVSVHSASPEEVATDAPPVLVDKEADADLWKEIEIVFLSEHRVQIFHNGASETLNYAEFGFNDRRGGNPTKPWKVFAELAGNGGILYKNARFAAKWEMLSKHIDLIRKVLRGRFGIRSNPIPYVRKKGFQARFKVRRLPSYEV